MINVFVATKEAYLVRKTDELFNELCGARGFGFVPEYPQSSSFENPFRASSSEGIVRVCLAGQQGIWHKHATIAIGSQQGVLEVNNALNQAHKTWSYNCDYQIMPSKFSELNPSGIFTLVHFAEKEILSGYGDGVGFIRTELPVSRTKKIKEQRIIISETPNLIVLDYEADERVKRTSSWTYCIVKTAVYQEQPLTIIHLDLYQELTRTEQPKQHAHLFVGVEFGERGIVKNVLEEARRLYERGKKGKSKNGFKVTPVLKFANLPPLEMIVSV